jgi:hypothetical protein
MWLNHITVVPYQQDLLHQLMKFLGTEDGRVYWRYIKFDDLTNPTDIVVSDYCNHQWFTYAFGNVVSYC